MLTAGCTCSAATMGSIEQIAATAARKRRIPMPYASRSRLQPRGAVFSSGPWFCERLEQDAPLAAGRSARSSSCERRPAAGLASDTLKPCRCVTPRGRRDAGIDVSFTGSFGGDGIGLRTTPTRNQSA